MTGIFDYSHETSISIQRASALELLAHLRRLFEGGVDVARFHPLLGMLDTAMTPQHTVKVKQNEDRPRYQEKRKVWVPSVTATIKASIADAEEKVALARLQKMLNSYLSVASKEMIQRQLAFHSWASTAINNKGTISSVLVAGNSVAGVQLPYSLLVTPTKPNQYIIKRTSLRPLEIVAGVDWLKKQSFSITF